ncbi:MAG: SIR2 family protein [Candidatus Marinimicrobia bacterium]|nr:SIR2 family protein [Candidatus Neomarinimicrobiota bacterium]
MSEDLAFWESSGRKVLKIHGSINNYGSIIATTSDYDKCKDILTSGLIGSVLKTIIATKTIIYVGYSFRDDDLDYIFKFIRDEMKNLHRTSFFVTPHETPEEFLDNYGMIHICTDGTYFISELKKHAWCNKILIPDSIYEIGDCLLSEMRIEHKKLHENYNCYDNPEVILCSSYQDGVIHALERMQFLRSTGEYSDQHKISGVFNAYDSIRKEKLKQKRYEDVAYIDGYQSALGFILLIGHGNFKRPFPKYYIYGIKRDTINFSDYKKTVPNMHEYHKGAYSRIKRLIREQTKYGSKVEFHHRPIL